MAAGSVKNHVPWGIIQILLIFETPEEKHEEMNKANVKARIVQLQEERIKDLQQAYDRDLTSADIDEAETKDPEDFSHQGELNEMARRFELRLNKSKDELKYIQRLTVEPMNEVGEGALVVTKKYAFYVALATRPFELDGATVVGISTEAPIYMAMKDKKAGDSFSFNNQDYNIVSIQ